MAFSLEASLVVPAVLGACLTVMLPMIPACGASRRAAMLETEATLTALQGDSIYRGECIGDDSSWVAALTVSPQRVLELASLLADDVKLLARLLPDASTDQEGSGS